MADKDSQRISVKNDGSAVTTSCVSKGNGNFNYSVRETPNGLVDLSSDTMTAFVSTSTNMIVGTNKKLLVQSGTNQPIVVAAGSNIENVATSTTNTTGTKGEFGNDENAARNNAMGKRNASLANKGDGTDMQGATDGFSSILSSAMSFLSDVTETLSNIAGTISDDYSDANKLTPPATTGNFLTDANNYITFSAEYAATAASSKVKKMAELFSLKSNKKEASNIKLNLIKIFQSNKQLQRIDDATYAKLINEINSLSDEELIELGKSIQSSAQVGVTTDGAAIISL